MSRALSVALISAAAQDVSRVFPVSTHTHVSAARHRRDTCLTHNRTNFTQNLELVKFIAAVLVPVEYLVGL